MGRLPLVLLLLAGPVWAAGDLAAPDLPPGSVTPAQGLDAWARIEAVVSHPRCLNCHVGADNLPRWTGPEFPVDGVHGMAIDGGDSRIGAETLPCQSCHVTSTRPNTMPRAAPHAGLDWALAPVEMVWLGRSGAQICAQLRDPATNGGRDGAGLVEHILHDAEKRGFITWGFDPGPGREAAPGDLAAHLLDTATWVAAGMPCPER